MTDALYAHLESFEIQCCPTFQDEWLHLSALATRKWHLTRHALEHAVVAATTSTDATKIVDAALAIAEDHVRFRRIVMPFTTDSMNVREPLEKIDWTTSALDNAIMTHDHVMVELLLADERITLRNNYICVTFADDRFPENPALQYRHRGQLHINSLQYACRYGELQIVRLLMEHIDPSAPRHCCPWFHCRDCDDEPNIALYIAVAYGHVDLVRELVSDPRVRAARFEIPECQGEIAEILRSAFTPRL